MKIRAFNKPEDLMIALLNKEKWVCNGTVFSYHDFDFYVFNDPLNSFELLTILCDGKALWHKVEEKTELDLMKEKYASGKCICIFREATNDSWAKTVSTPLWLSYNTYKLIHKRHKELLDAYLADNSVKIEIKCRDNNAEWEWIDTDFIKNYNEDFEYRLKPKKKTISLAIFSCQRKDSKNWADASVHETIEDFKSIYDVVCFTNHHKIKGSDYEIEVDDE